MLWALPAGQVLSSAISGYHYGRRIFALARLQPLPRFPFADSSGGLDKPCPREGETKRVTLAFRDGVPYIR